MVRQLRLNHETKVDCLELFDFLYLFLLMKVLPHERLESWIGEDDDEDPYRWRAGNQATRDRFAVRWDCFLSNCRWVLQPHDLAELIERV